MREYFIFIFLFLLFLVIARLTRNIGYKNLKIYRKAAVKSVKEGEELDISIVIENNKWLPISFLCLTEIIPSDINVVGNEKKSELASYYSHVTKYSILWKERVKRTYTVIGEKRGTYLLRNIKTSLGDIFGFVNESREMEDYIEILVMPKLIDIDRLKFESRSTMGNTIVKRWIYKDPLYIKGIREYTVEDRMKDIHWKSSLKMNKFMVKDYDNTSDHEVIFIINVQAGEPYWDVVNVDAVERGIKVSTSLAAEFIRKCVPAGIWTNAHIRSYLSEYKSEVQPSLNALKSIMELSARMDYIAQSDFNEYLNKMSRYFNSKCTYIVVTSFLDEKSIGTLYKLKKHGINLKLVDVSNDGSVPVLSRIERVVYGGEKTA